MWLALAFGSALFAGITSILAKRGIIEANSNVATAVRTIVVPIDKRSILVTIAFSYIVFHEHLSPKARAGLVLTTVGTLGLLL